MRGLIKPHEVDVVSPRWWAKARYIFDLVEWESEKEIRKATLAFFAAQVANGSLTEASFNEVQGKAKDAHSDILGAYRPWEGASAKIRKAKYHAHLIETYKRKIGDPNAPDWPEKEARILEALRNPPKDEYDEPPDPMAEIMKRLHEQRQATIKSRRRLI